MFLMTNVKCAVKTMAIVLLSIVPNEELANKVLAIADNLGYKWHSGNRYIKDNHWRISNRYFSISITIY